MVRFLALTRRALCPGVLVATGLAAPSGCDGAAPPAAEVAPATASHSSPPASRPAAPPFDPATYDPGWKAVPPQTPRTTRTVTVHHEGSWKVPDPAGARFELARDVESVFRFDDRHRDVVLDLKGFRVGGVQIDGSPDNIAVVNGAAGFVRWQVGGGYPTDVTFRDLAVRREGGSAFEFIHGDRILMADVTAHSDSAYAVWGGQGGQINNWIIEGGRYTCGAEQNPLRFYDWEQVRFTRVHVEKLAPRHGTDHWVSAIRAYNGWKMLVDRCTLVAGGSVWGGSWTGGPDTDSFAHEVHLVGNTIRNRETISPCVRLINGKGCRIIGNAFHSPADRAYETRRQREFEAYGNSLNGTAMGDAR